MKAENFDYSALPQDAFELTHNDINAHVDRNFASQNYWKDAFVRFIRNKGAIFGLFMIAIIIFFAVFGPAMTPYTYESQIIEQQNLAPRIPGLENLGIFDGSETIYLKGRGVEKNYYEEKVSKNPNWTLVGIYADEGISGTSLLHREAFNRMIEDCKAGKIDMIITKSVSRFARNIVDSLSFVRKLKAMGIAIYFEEQNINSLKEESETYSGI